MGYHVAEIPKGVYGELSKVKEEVEEALDAEKQDNPVMVLVELSDIIGAIHGYLLENYGETITIEDLITMCNATQRAFRSGDRK